MFFSRELKHPELRYRNFGRELLAMSLMVKHVRPFSERHAFTVFTDHKPLICAFFASGTRYSLHEACHLTFVMEFTTDITSVVLIVQRWMLSVSLRASPALYLDDLAQAQSSDAKLVQYCSGSTYLVIKDVTLPSSSTAAACKSSQGWPRPFVPLPCYAGHTMRSLTQVPALPCV